MGDAGKQVARALRAQGWAQGSVLDFDFHAFVFDPEEPKARIARGFLNRWRQEVTARARATGQDAPVMPPALSADYGTIGAPSDVRQKAIVVSQTCDILADADDEPWVEIMRLARGDDFMVRMGSGKSARVFCVDHGSAWVADARHRTRVDKGVLLAQGTAFLAVGARMEILPPEEILRNRFRLWLGRRFTRPALPDDLDDALRRPLEMILSSTDPDGIALANAYHVCSEIRHQVVGATAPYQVHMLFLTDHARDAKDIEARVTGLIAALSANLERTVVSHLSGDVRGLDEISAATYLQTQPFLLDYFTHGGSPVDAAPPPPDRL